MWMVSPSHRTDCVAMAQALQPIILASRQRCIDKSHNSSKTGSRRSRLSDANDSHHTMDVLEPLGEWVDAAPTWCEMATPKKHMSLIDFSTPQPPRSLDMTPFDGALYSSLRMQTPSLFSPSLDLPHGLLDSLTPVKMMGYMPWSPALESNIYTHHM
jgi:hypothetical protein